MKIMEAVAAYDAGQKIKIGAKEGTGWWYVGTVGDVRQYLEVLNDKCLKYAWAVQKNAVETLDTRLKKWPTPESFARLQLRRAADGKDLDLSMDSYLAAVKQYFADVWLAQRHLEQATARLRGYIPLAFREVVDVSKSEPCESGDPGVVRVLLAGYEYGAFWTTDEAETFPAVKFLNNNEQEDE